MLCPKCKRFVPAGARVCKHCGKALAIAAPRPAEPTGGRPDESGTVRPPDLPASGLNADTVLPSAPDLSALSRELDAQLSAAARGTADWLRASAAGASPATATATADDLFREAPKIVRIDDPRWGREWFDIAVDTLIPYVAGEICNTIRMCYTSNEDGMSDVRLTLKPAVGEIVTSDGDIGSPPKGATVTDRLFCISKLRPGTVPCSVELVFLRGGMRYCYKGSFLMAILSDKDSSEQAVSNIQFHFENSFNQHAGGSSLKAPSLDIGDLLKRRGKTAAEQVAEMVRSGSRTYLRIAMTLRRIEPVKRPGPDEAELRGVPKCDRKSVLLDLNGLRVVFFCDPEVKVGRPVIGSEEGQVSRPHDGIMIEPPDVGASDVKGTWKWITGDVLPYKSVSREHCELRFGRNGGVEIRDRKRHTCLAEKGTGTAKAIDENWTPVTPGCLALGVSATALTMDLELYRCETCDDCRSRCGFCKGGRLSGVILRRRDAPVAYVLLWSCLDLGLFMPRYGGVRIKWNQGAFQYEFNGTTGWLLPGREIQVSEFDRITVSKAWNK